jgi:hypothetical protein
MRRAFAALSPQRAPSLLRFFTSLPPHAVVGLPALSPTMQTGVIAEWCFKEGQTIKSGSIIARVETDKATVDYEATDDTVLAKILRAFYVRPSPARPKRP